MIENLWLILVGLSCGITIAETLNRKLYKGQKKIIDLQAQVIEKYEDIMMKVLHETNKHTERKDRELN